MIDDIPIELEEEIRIQVVPSILTHTSIVSNVQQMIIDSNISPKLCPFFIDDSGLSKLDLSDKRYKSKPHDVKFRIRWFVYYVFLYLIFRQLGILLTPIFLLKKNGMIMLRNFGMIGHQPSTYYNNCIIIINAIIIVLFSQLQLDFLQYQLLFAYSTYIISQAIVVAIKLAFYHPLKLELLETVPTEKLDNSLEVNIDPTAWVTQQNELINFEIQQSIKRSNIEPGQFIFYFMVQPNEKRRLKIQHQYEKKLTEEDKYAGNGAKIAEEIITYFNKRSPVKLYLAIAVFLTICRIGIVFYYCNFFANVEQTVLFVLVMIMQTKFYILQIAAMLFAFRDLQRKVFAMNQLSHLLSAQQVELYDETKLFPTLNFLCIISLFSWSNLRKILLDYGLQYSQRQTYLISYLLIVLLSTTAEGIYCYINPNQFDTEQIYRYMMVVEYDICSILLLSIMIVLQGARINNHFLIHKGMLRKNLFIYEQLTSQVFLDQQHQFEPTDFVFRTLKNTLKKAKMQENDFVNYSQFVINAIETVYQDLTYDEEYQPFTVLGVAMTNKLLLQLIFSFLGILGTVLANIYLNMNL